MGPTAIVLLDYVPAAEEIERFGQLVNEINPHLEQSLNTPETERYGLYPEEQRQEILLCTSFHVQSWYLLISPINGDQEHKELGKACLFVAKAAQGLIDFGGAILPQLPDHMYKQMWLWEQAQWSDVQPFFSELARSIPGNIYTLPYLTAGGREWASHICDVQFMEGWLAHPNFHMIK